MKLMKSIAFGLAVLGAPCAFAAISNLPADMVVMSCTDVSSGHPTVELIDFGSDTYATAFYHQGKSVSLFVYMSSQGYSSKVGSLHNVRLIQKANGLYEFSVFVAQMDGSDGSAVVAPVIVSCKP